MTAVFLRRLGLVLIAPLALAACDKGGADGAPAAGPSLAKVAPPAGKAWADVVSVTPEGGYRMGNPDAPIKLVEYGSLTCPHCAEFAEKSAAELRDPFVSSGRVSFEFRNYIRDAIDLTGVMLTRCGPPEGFFALTDAILANQKSFYDKAQSAGKPAQDAAFGQEPARRGPAIGALTGLTQFAAARGIPAAQGNACLADTAKAEALAAQISKQADQLGVTGTPTFLLNGEKLEVNTWDAVKPLLEQAGAR
ncbi:protein-disulfide isomerase [Novosphingobium kunmingense]|uniref:Protein-disulfide isomerase n=1 Tax=Novosphingobium kunmingense TaxID=1211806 RepID=A0A2N0I433_9SPHN|nr:thioredoxin domain-containing protein [Novosphingobium kunmingense]PKB25940.1 protein-disulfide isomerase [Novosphingobium kunmingense]